MCWHPVDLNLWHTIYSNIGVKQYIEQQFYFSIFKLLFWVSQIGHWHFSRVDLPNFAKMRQMDTPVNGANLKKLAQKIKLAKVVAIEGKNPITNPVICSYIFKPLHHHLCWKCSWKSKQPTLSTVMFLSFWTDRSGQIVQTQIRSYRSSLIRVYTVCNSLCIIWMHYSKEKPSCSTFRVITANFQLSVSFLDFYGSSSRRLHYLWNATEQVWP